MDVVVVVVVVVVAVAVAVVVVVVVVVRPGPDRGEEVSDGRQRTKVREPRGPTASYVRNICMRSSLGWLRLGWLKIPLT